MKNRENVKIIFRSAFYSALAIILMIIGFFAARFFFGPV